MLDFIFGFMLGLFRKTVKRPYTDFHVAPSKEFLMSRAFKDFCNAAYEAYDNSNSRFFKKLSDQELVVLYASCYLHESYPLTLAYDDEVFEALFRRKKYVDLINSANELIFNNLDDKTLENAYADHFPRSDGNCSIQEKRQQLIDKTKLTIPR